MNSHASRRRADENSNIRELRLGLVCYGGVSLAIYMHGITKELQKLVVASSAFEHDQNSNPFVDSPVESAYWQALQTAWKESGKDGGERVITRVVIDVVAGTSAGGINGVILCKALANNRSQDALRDLWFERGDFVQLLGGKFRWRLRLGKFAFNLLRNRAQPPLDGEAMLGWLYNALAAIDRSSPAYQPKNETPPASLMPEAHPLQLFVTTTDYYGYRNTMLIEDPATVAERRNRHLLKFHNRDAEGNDQFDAGHNGALAFAARSTSSFPGAFPPAKLADIKEHIADLEGFAKEFFAAYELSGAEPCETYFIDGGVLNNYPFQPAIDAIVKARAEAEVDRYLLYIQPDPGPEAQNPDGQPPTLFGAIWAGLSRVAAAQPIYDQLLAIRAFNERVRMVDDMTAEARKEIPSLLAALEVPLDHLQEADADALAAKRDQADSEVEKRAGFLYQPYLEVRVEAVVAQLARVAANLCGYIEPDSNISYLIRLVVHEWARRRGLLGKGADLQGQKDFLRDFDLGFTQRRLAFVLDGVNKAYKSRGESQVPRVALNRAKAALFERIEQLTNMIGGGGLKERHGGTLRAIFPLTLLKKAGKVPLGDVVAEIVEQEGKLLDTLRREVGKVLSEGKKAVHFALYEDFREITRNWPSEARQEVVQRYLGFPVWDAMIYPVVRLSEAGELREIKVMRVSPLDSTVLGAMTVADKLKGVQLAHFGAFKRLDWRQNDYLWGRLDAAERLIGLVLRDVRRQPAAGNGPGHAAAAGAGDGAGAGAAAVAATAPAAAVEAELMTSTGNGGARYRPSPGEVKLVFLAILKEEKDSLKAIPKTRAELKARVDALPDGPPSSSPPAL